MLLLYRKTAEKESQTLHFAPCFRNLCAQVTSNKIKEGSGRSAVTIQEAIEKIQEHVQRRMREMRVSEVLRNTAEPKMLEAADQSTEMTRKESKLTMTENKKVEG